MRRNTFHPSNRWVTSAVTVACLATLSLSGCVRSPREFASNLFQSKRTKAEEKEKEAAKIAAKKKGDKSDEKLVFDKTTDSDKDKKVKTASKSTKSKSLAKSSSSKDPFLDSLKDEEDEKAKLAKADADRRKVAKAKGKPTDRSTAEDLDWNKNWKDLDEPLPKPRTKKPDPDTKVAQPKPKTNDPLPAGRVASVDKKNKEKSTASLDANEDWWDRMGADPESKSKSNELPANKDLAVKTGGRIKDTNVGNSVVSADENRIIVTNLMQTSKKLEAKGNLQGAFDVAQEAAEIAEQKQVRFKAKEEHPAQLADRLATKMESLAVESAPKPHNSVRSSSAAGPENTRSAILRGDMQFSAQPPRSAGRESRTSFSETTPKDSFANSRSRIASRSRDSFPENSDFAQWQPAAESGSSEGRPRFENRRDTRSSDTPDLRDRSRRNEERDDAPGFDQYEGLNRRSSATEKKETEQVATMGLSPHVPIVLNTTPVTMTPTQAPEPPTAIKANFEVSEAELSLPQEGKAGTSADWRWFGLGASVVGAVLVLRRRKVIPT